MDFREEIKEKLENGEQFRNESADWFTMNSPMKSLMILYIDGEHITYETMDSYTDKVVELLSN